MEIISTIRWKAFQTFTFLLSSIIVQGCAHDSSTEHATEDSHSIYIKGGERRSGYESILVLMPVTTETKNALVSLKDELVDDFDIVVHSITEDSTPKEIGDEIEKTNPACLVLMNNNTVKLYQQYQAGRPKEATFPPGIVLMTSYLGEIYHKVKNLTGIAYEVPEVTIFVNLRSFLDRPVNKIGVIYRPQLKNYLEQQMKFAAVEKFETIPIEVRKKPTSRDIRKALRKLYQDHKVDAIWVLNDNALLMGEDLIPGGWLKELHRKPMPIVVGVKSLVHKGVQFGSFAMVPDHSALGVQAANIIFELADEEWAIGSRTVEQPLSIRTVIDIEYARKHLDFKEEMLGQIDVVVQ